MLQSDLKKNTILLDFNETVQALINQKKSIKK